MKEEFIYLQGCRENSLKDIYLEIPKSKITIFTGVAGSGKSALIKHEFLKQNLLKQSFKLLMI